MSCPTRRSIRDKDSLYRLDRRRFWQVKKENEKSYEEWLEEFKSSHPYEYSLALLRNKAEAYD